MDSARFGVVTLRLIAVGVALASGVGQLLAAMDRTDGPGYSFTSRQQWMVFLTGIAVPLAFAGLLVAASYLLAVYAARLDMDIVLADDNDNA